MIVKRLLKNISSVYNSFIVLSSDSFLLLRDDYLQNHPHHHLILMLSASSIEIYISVYGYCNNTIYALVCCGCCGRKGAARIERKAE